MRLRVDHALPLAALTLLAACGSGPQGIEGTPAAARVAYGPASDYPIVIGSPYQVGGVSYTPVDTMNYDQVGRAQIGPEGGSGITAAHHTLPLPSYVEVTALDTGRTILARIERRGPMRSNAVVELSPAAAAQLGLTSPAGTAVRVRRVNPIEPERALLRSGQAAPARMETPRSLLVVLMRKLDAQEGVIRPAPGAEPAPVPAPRAARENNARSMPAQAQTPVPAQKPAPAPAPAPVARGKFVVQVGAFSSQANARAAAGGTGGSLVQVGNLWRVRLGPFASEAAARSALAKARAAGYSDARIQSAN
jgi:rare lipoprotein A